jgi:hypothetical protein
VDSDLIFRPWLMAGYYAAGGILFGFHAVFDRAWMAAPAVVFFALAGWQVRQQVVIDDYQLTAVGLLRHDSVPWAGVDRVDVRFSPLRGWRLRFWYGEDHVDTFSCWPFINFRMLPASFDSPPADVPSVLRRIYAAAVARLPRDRSVTSGP